MNFSYAVIKKYFTRAANNICHLLQLPRNISYTACKSQTYISSCWHIKIKQLVLCHRLTDAAIAMANARYVIHRYVMKPTTVVVIIISLHSGTNTNICNVILTNN